MNREQIFQDRINKFLNIGRQKCFQGKIQNSYNLVMKKNFYDNYLMLIKKYKIPIFSIIFLFLIFVLL